MHGLNACNHRTIQRHRKLKIYNRSKDRGYNKMEYNTQRNDVHIFDRNTDNRQTLGAILKSDGRNIILHPDYNVLWTPKTEETTLATFLDIEGLDFLRKNEILIPSWMRIGMGKNVKLWNWVQIRENVKIGNDCIIAKGVYIDNDVAIGNKVKIQNNVSIFNGVTIEDGVFIAPHVCFTNDKIPRAINKDNSLKNNKDWTISKTLVKEGASIGANSTILPGIIIGRFAMIGAGSVVTKNVPDFALVYGNPAQIISEIDKEGNEIIN